MQKEFCLEVERDGSVSRVSWDGKSCYRTGNAIVSTTAGDAVLRMTQDNTKIVAKHSDSVFYLYVVGPEIPMFIQKMRHSNMSYTDVNTTHWYLKTCVESDGRRGVVLSKKAKCNSSTQRSIMPLVMIVSMFLLVLITTK